MNDPPGTLRPAMNILMDEERMQNNESFYDENGIVKYIEKMKQEGIF